MTGLLALLAAFFIADMTDLSFWVAPPTLVGLVLLGPLLPALLEALDLGRDAAAPLGASDDLTSRAGRSVLDGFAAFVNLSLLLVFDLLVAMPGWSSPC
jgi:hypothetical protein